MKALNLKYLLIGLALLAAAAGGAALKPTRYIADQGPKINLETMIPKQFGDWSVDSSIIPIPPSPDQQARLAETYDQIVSRTYVNRDGKRIMISIAYGSRQDQKLKAHRQEVCYAAQGFEIRNLVHEIARVAGIDIIVTRMLAASKHRQEPVTYWFTVGDRVVQSHMQRLLAQIRYGLTGTISDGILVRISSLGADDKQAYQDHLAFISALLDTMPAQTRARFVGNPM